MKQLILGLGLFLLGCVFVTAENSRILFVCGEEQYGTEESLRSLAAGPLKEAGYESTFVTAGPVDLKDPERNKFEGLLEGLAKCDVLVVATWRRFPSEDEMAGLKKWVADGKPVLGIRTGSHAFSARKNWTVPEGHLAWEDFDQDVFGAKYSNHAPLVKEETLQATIRRDVDWLQSPFGKTLPLKQSKKVSTVLYRMENLDEGAKVLVWGKPLHHEEVEQPVIWGLERDNHRAVFTSLGAKSDFVELPWLDELFVDAFNWLTGRAVSQGEASP